MVRTSLQRNEREAAGHGHRTQLVLGETLPELAVCARANTRGGAAGAEHAGVLLSSHNAGHVAEYEGRLETQRVAGAESPPIVEAPTVHVATRAAPATVRAACHHLCKAEAAADRRGDVDRTEAAVPDLPVIALSPAKPRVGVLLLNIQQSKVRLFLKGCSGR